MKGLYLFFIVIGNLPCIGQVFPKNRVLEDLHYLKSSLEEAHYNLYAYTSRETFQENFDQVCASLLKDSFNLLETTSLFQSVISKANNGHTEISFPGNSYIQYAYSGGTLFPLELAFENDKALVRKNWSADPSIPPATEIISINGLPMTEILDRIFPLISAERRYFKLAKIELISFPRLYWQAFGKQDEFQIEVYRNHQIQKISLRAISVIDGYEMKRNEIFSDQRILKFLDQAAYLKPGNFSGDLEQFKHFIDSSFAAIKLNQSPNLIIDLRNNAGGDDAFSDYLVSYIADQPFQWCSAFSLKTSAILKAHVRSKYDTTQAYWRSVLTHADGSIYPYSFPPFQPQSAEVRYSCEVYVLINRQSHSQAAVTAAEIQDYQWATIVGEETGDYPSLYASQYSYNLPHTGIEVKISKGYIVRVSGDQSPNGVRPDIPIQDHLLDENDEILEGLMNRWKE